LRGQNNNNNNNNNNNKREWVYLGIDVSEGAATIDGEGALFVRLHCYLLHLLSFYRKITFAEQPQA
jgi:hypothetical protein